MTTRDKINKAFDILFLCAAIGVMVGMILSAVGCAVAKTSCKVIDLADMACEYVSVEFVDPQTGKRTTATVRKTSLTGAVKAAAAAEAQP